MFDSNCLSCVVTQQILDHAARKCMFLTSHTLLLTILTYACPAGGETAKDACHICPAGTWSPGNSTEPCIPCGFGHSSPAGSASQDACYATNACPTGTEVHRMLGDGDSLASCVCKPGFGSVPGQGICRICPANTFAYGGSLEECSPCPFGTTSAPGSTGEDECKKNASPCPIGQAAPPGAVGPQQCACLPGYGGKSWNKVRVWNEFWNSNSTLLALVAICQQRL
jgi:hypothetical protein